MQVLLALVPMHLLSLDVPDFPKPAIEAGPALNDGDLCDIPTIVQHTFWENSRPGSMGQTWITAKTTIRVERLPDLSWDFRVFLRSKVLKNLMTWRLRAETCERAARRTALKLVLFTESLQQSILSTRRPISSGSPSPEPRSLDATPVIQRPSWVVDPGLRSISPVRSADDASPSVARPRLDNLPDSAANTVKSKAARGEEVDHARNSALSTSPDVRQLLPVRSDRIPVGVRIRLSARTGHSVLPQPVFGGGQLHVGLVVGRARVETGVTISSAGRLVVPGDVRTRWPYHLSLQLHGCGEHARISLESRLCLGFEGGLIVLTTATSVQRPWTLHLLVSPSLTWWFERHVGLHVGLMVGPSLVRPNFYVGAGPGADAIAERSVPAFLFTGSLGFEFRVPIP